MRILTFMITFFLSINAYANDKELIVGAWEMVKFEVQNEQKTWE